MTISSPPSSVRRAASRLLAAAAYDAVATLGALLVLPLLPCVALTRYGRGLSERLGRVPARLDRPLWIHAASVGEVLAAAPLVTLLRREWPDRCVLFTTTSAAGRRAAAQLPVDAAMLLPVDVPLIVQRVVRRLRPRALIIVETEIWPALLRAAAARRIPVVLVSGRISPRAAARYARIAWLTRAVLPQVSGFAMQSRADAERIIALGAPPERVCVLGNLKSARQSAAAVAPAAPGVSLNGRPLLVAASTHGDEEALVLDACEPFWAEGMNPLLLLAPRRPERFDEVEALLRRRGLAYARRSQAGGAIGATTRVVLLDTLGELPNVLPSAHAVFVGGTIAPIGGHNVLEPGLSGKPVAFGPHVDNVAESAAALLAAGAATRVRDARELGAEWRRLLRDPAAAAEMGARAAALVQAGAAVARETCDFVLRCCGEERR